MKKILSLVCIIFFNVFYAQVVPRPDPPRLYNNFSKEFPQFLNAAEAAQLEEKLEQFSNETSNQICVVIVDDLNGDDAPQYAYKIGTEWGVGKKGFNNGLVILIKPTGSAGGRDLAISTGYGLEGAIPDLATKRVREEMYPYLKSGDNFAALDKGTDLLMKLAKGEINVKDYTRKSGRGGRSPLSIAIIIIIIIIVILKNLFGGGGGRTFSRTGSALFWGSMLGGGGRGFGGGGGSSSGGGWGGFGGGGFGGGGSSGKW
jgi:uncharacterized protein